MTIEVEVANEQDRLQIDAARMVDAARRVLAGEGVTAGTVSLAVVDDLTIHELNRRYLGHDYPTDVLSFLLEKSVEEEVGPGGPTYALQGEVIVSADTAISTAARLAWSPQEEVLLYIVHGCLHLVGYDDQADEDLAKMRQRERHYLAELGIEAR